MPKIYLVDTETCGFAVPSTGSAVVQLAWLELDEDGEVVNEECHIVKPTVPISPEATAVHGYLDSDVANAPSIDTIWREPDVFIAYNAGFDARHLRVTNAQIVDVLKLARRYFPNLPNHKLGTVAQHVGTPIQKAHDALSDCRAALSVLKYIQVNSERGMTEIVDTPAQNVHIMPFGVHKGKAVADLPAPYARYLLGLNDLDADLRRTLEVLF